MKLMRFNEYSKAQKSKFELFAKIARGRVLDIGATQAPNPFFDDKVKEVYLLDIKRPDTELPSKYKEIIIFDLNKVDRDKLPFQDNSFDTVILGDVIEHIYYPVSLLKEVHRITKKKEGLLLLSSPSSKYYVELIYSLLFSKPMGFPEHKILFTREQMKNVLEYTGFTLKKIVGHNIWIPILKLGFVNTDRTLPELLTWRQIYIAIAKVIK